MSCRRWERRRQSTFGTPRRAFRSASTSLQPAGRLAVTELVAVQPPEPLATFLDLNGYLPIGVPMLKRVSGASWTNGLQERALTISVDGDRNGQAQRARWSRPSATGLAGMPRRWRRTTLSHELAIDQLSGRPLLWACPSAVIGKALPVWTKED